MGVCGLAFVAFYFAFWWYVLSLVGEKPKDPKIQTDGACLFSLFLDEDIQKKLFMMGFSRKYACCAK